MSVPFDRIDGTHYWVKHVKSRDYITEEPMTLRKTREFIGGVVRNLEWRVSLKEIRSQIPSQLQIYIERLGHRSGACKYYIVSDDDPETPIVFWFDKISPQTLTGEKFLGHEHWSACFFSVKFGNSDLFSFSLSGLRMQLEYWTHCERFPDAAKFQTTQIRDLKETTMRLVVGGLILSLSCLLIVGNGQIRRDNGKIHHSISQ